MDCDHVHTGSEVRADPEGVAAPNLAQARVEQR